MDKITKNGMVMEVCHSDSKVVLMTNDGEFIKKKYDGVAPDLGTEIQFTLERAPEKKPFLTRWKQSGLAVAAVLLLMIIVPAMLNYVPVDSKTVAYVTVDVNPSIELGINDKDIVTSSQGLNEKGKAIVNELDLKGMTCQEAISSLTTYLVKEGYIAELEAGRMMISLSSVSKDSEYENKMSDMLAQTARTTLADNNAKFTLVSTVQVDEELRLSSEKAGVSPGKYLLMLESRNSSSENNYGEMSIAKSDEQVEEPKKEPVSEEGDNHVQKEPSEAEKVQQNDNTQVGQDAEKEQEKQDDRREQEEREAIQLAENKKRIDELEDKKFAEIARLPDDERTEKDLENETEDDDEDDEENEAEDDDEQKENEED